MQMVSPHRPAVVLHTCFAFVARSILNSASTLCVLTSSPFLLFPYFFFSFLEPFSSTMPLEARVKSVLSGDTLVLSHVTNRGQERTLSLAYVSAPRLRREGDEVCYFILFYIYIFFLLTQLTFPAIRICVARIPSGTARWQSCPVRGPVRHPHRRQARIRNRQTPRNQRLATGAGRARRMGPCARGSRQTR
jgi:hypothetical protein